MSVATTRVIKEDKEGEVKGGKGRNGQIESGLFTGQLNMQLNAF